MSELPDIPGLAALAVCESLLLALNDRKVMPESAIVGVLRDAARAQEDAAPGDGMEESRLAAAGLLHKIIDGHNSVRRP